jgi:hypothetical protein
MKPSEKPLTVLLRKLLQNFRHQQDFYKSYDREEFLEEMRFLRRKQLLEPPPNWIKKFYKKGGYEKLECVGFHLSNRFPNNIAIVRDDSHEFGHGVVWVTRIEYDPKSKQTANVYGHKFCQVIGAFL